MKIGSAKLDISPKFPVTMGGYGDRNGKSIGILDPIYVRTLLLEDEIGQRIVIISADLIGLSQEQVKIIKEQINKITNIAQDCIVVSTTHTHSGPLTNDNPVMGKADKDYVYWLLEAIPGTVVKALESLQSCKLGWYQGEFKEVGASRRTLNKEVKTILTVLAAVNSDNSLIGVLFNYNCHPTVLPAENFMISADYPGAAINLLEKEYGDKAFIAFTNGACGDISTRFVRRNQDYQEVKRLGSLLASEVIKVIDMITYEEVLNVLAKERIFTLEPRELPDEELLNREMEEYKKEIAGFNENGGNQGDVRIAHTALQGLRVQKLLSEYRSELEFGGYLNAIKIGNNVILTHPAELFSSLGYEIMSNSPYNQTMVVGYANGSIGYIPDRNSYNEGGYESFSCSFKAGEGERLRDLAVSLLQEME